MPDSHDVRQSTRLITDGAGTIVDQVFDGWCVTCGATTWGMPTSGCIASWADYHTVPVHVEPEPIAW